MTTKSSTRVTFGEKAFRSDGGFTLLEMMVASGITIFLVSILVGMISAVTSGWQRVQGSLSTEAQARLVLDQLAVDLESAVFKPDGGVWLAFSVVTLPSADAYLDAHGWQRTIRASLPSHTVLLKPDSDDPNTLDLNESDLTDARYGQAGGWLRFFTTDQDSNTGDRDLSAPTAVSYQIVRRNVSGGISNNPGTNPAEIRYQFYRAVVRKTESSSLKPGSFQIGYDLTPIPDFGYYDINDLDIGDPGTVTKPPASGLLANNVIDFGIRLYVSGVGGERLIFPADGSGGLVDSSVDPDHFASSAIPGDAGRFPDVVEIMIRILTDEGARLIQNLEAGRIEGDWWEIADAHSRVFTRRVQTLARFPTP